MRKLLVFGTGAAIIGILLLVFAFYEAYNIVSALQSKIGQSSSDNSLLEDATLEAIFLGLMAALGYGLISKGLDGIRRQALLEYEGSAENTFGPRNVQVRADNPRYVARSLSRSTSTKVKQEKTSGLHPGLKQASAQTAGTVGTTTATVVYGKDEKTASRSASESSPMAEQTASASTSIIQESTASGTEHGPEQSGSQSSWSNTSAAQAGGSNSEGSKPGEIVWESGAPPVLQGVEVLPEPAAHGAEAALGSTSDQMNESQTPQAGESYEQMNAKPKRGRGRPKGSKSSKKGTNENSSESTNEGSSTST
jgi:hypothetical protein